MIPVLDYTRCPAKTYRDHLGESQPSPITVRDHCLVVGTIAQALMDRLPVTTRQQLPDNSAALAALHDIGKVSPGFLQRCGTADLCPDLPPLRFEGNHCETGQRALLDFLLDRGTSQATADSYSELLGWHHGWPCELQYAKADARPYGGPGWQEQRVALIQDLLATFPCDFSTGLNDLQQTLVLGLIVLADWIGSDESEPYGFPTNQSLQQILGNNSLRHHVEIALDKIGFEWPAAQPNLTFDQLFRTTIGSKQEVQANELQQALHDSLDGPGIYILEGPTGHGKTEAALWAAYTLIRQGHHNGLYFALPTRLTSNRIYHRVGSFLTSMHGYQTPARLLHAHAWLDPAGCGNLGYSWFNPLKRGLLWPFAVGTVDQALTSMIQVKHNFLRQFGLAGKVVILDEIHSYDVFTSALIQKLIERLLELKCTVIILSATLTAERRRRLLQVTKVKQQRKYPLVTVSTTAIRTRPVSPPSNKRCHLRSFAALEQALGEIGPKLASGYAVLCVCNTVDEAQERYQQACNRYENIADIGLIHAKYPAWLRGRLEEYWMRRLGKSASRERGCLLIGTQVVEQSLDIDSDLLITELAPTDMLIQRMGRLWRHNIENRPAKRMEAWICSNNLNLAENASTLSKHLGRYSPIYDHYVLYRTFQLWRRRRYINIPRGQRSILEATYIEPQPNDPKWVRGLYQEMQRRGEEDAELASLMGKPWFVPFRRGHEEDELEAKTRLDGIPRINVLILSDQQQVGDQPYLTLLDGSQVTIADETQSYETLRAIHNNVIQAPRNHFEEPQIGQTPEWVRDILSDSSLVLQNTGQQLTHLDGTQATVGYSEPLGLYRIQP